MLLLMQVFLFLGILQLPWSSFVGVAWGDFYSLKLIRIIEENQTQDVNKQLVQVVRALEIAKDFRGDQSRSYEALIKAYTLQGDYRAVSEALSQYVFWADDTRIGMIWLIQQAQNYTERGMELEATQIRRLIAEQVSEVHYQKNISNYKAQSEHIASHAQDYIRTHQYSVAEEIYRLVTTVDPRSAKSYYSLGNLYRMQKKWEEAVTTYYEGIVVDTTIPITGYIGLGKVYMAQEKADELIIVAQAALEAGAWEWGHVMLGRALEWKGNETDAIQHYLMVIEKHSCESDLLEPTWMAFIYLGNIFENRRQYEVAIDYYHRAASLPAEYGSDAQAQFYEAQVYRKQGLLINAIVILKDAIYSINSQSGQENLHVTLLIALADIYRDNGELNLAIDYYREVLEINPTNNYARQEIQKILSR